MGVMIKAEWEMIAHENLSHTYRLPVYGGWIVMTVYGEGRCSSFVPDPTWQWMIKPNHE